jgi:signal transduction histidine kinase
MMKFREALKLQEQFVASVTHELKTPLAAIGSALEILDGEAKKGLDPEMSRLLDVSRRNARVLQQMIGEILDFSRIQSGRMSVNLEPVSVSDVVSEAVEGLLPWAQGRGLDLRCDPAQKLSRLPKIRADRHRLVQVLNNLISNAIKATPEGGRITLAVSRGEKEHDGAVVFAVKDTGCGIAAEDQNRIFERFTQLHTQGMRREGVGLGLAIVHELVSLHHGSLWLESEKGRGATFFFEIPEDR